MIKVIPEETYWEKANRTRMGIYITNTEMHFIFNSQSLREYGLAVDVGAGAGRFSLPLAKSMCVVAIDLDMYALKRLKFKNRNINVILADARFMPLKQGVANNVIMIELLDYVAELKTVIFECSRVLKNYGSVIFSFGNKSSIKGKMKDIIGKPYLHSYKEVLNALKNTELKIIKKEGFSWLPFDRVSNNPSVPLFAKMEKYSRLGKLIRFSPWIMIQAIKVATACADAE